METFNYQPESRKQKRKKLIFFAVVFVLAAATLAGIMWRNKKISQKEEKERMAAATVETVPVEKPEMAQNIETIPERRFVPANFSMETLKTRGCVADGILSGYGGKTEKAINLIDRSQCQYLHRALETWLDDPDFEQVADTMAEFKKPNLIFGMFIAEAIKTGQTYRYPDRDKKLDFSDMCREGTEGRWGDHTCIPTFSSKKYREYLKSITQRAMDIGIQSFMFGQVYLQDEKSAADSELPGIIKDMRDYAKKKNLQIVIGAQTNSITDEKYLKLFDFIEGGVGIDGNGNIEDGPCWSGKQSCWALLWNNQFRKKAQNVFLHLDWSGIQGDDMSKFALMDEDEREKTLRKLYRFFVGKDMGFLMPFLAPLYPENGGCYGPKKRFYSPDDKYKCKDENVINSIFAGN